MTVGEHIRRDTFVDENGEASADLPLAAELRIENLVETRHKVRDMLF